MVQYIRLIIIILNPYNYNPLYVVMYPLLLVCERKVQFVDESTISVNYDELIGRGSNGTVYRGSYQGTPAAVKKMEIGDNPVTTNELIIPW